jgi:beta-lactamase family protein
MADKKQYVIHTEASRFAHGGAVQDCCTLCTKLFQEQISMNPRRVRQLVIASVFLMMVAPAWTLNGSPADLDAYVARSMVLLKGYSVQKLGEITPVDENTLFGIASNTKAFTAAAPATLVKWWRK